MSAVSTSAEGRRFSDVAPAIDVLPRFLFTAAGLGVALLRCWVFPLGVKVPPDGIEVSGSAESIFTRSPRTLSVPRSRLS